MSLIGFLLARIAEDEELARLASPGPWCLNSENDAVMAVDGIEVAEACALSSNQERNTARHIARHNPTRVLAECVAKRRIALREQRRVDWHEARREEWAYSYAVVDLATTYSDHPDYDERWRP